MKRRILCIDGGGIKGIIPAAVCVEIERQTGKKINELFDLISGTSTGTILGAGLALGIPAQVMLDLYMVYGEEIFTKRIRWFRPWQYITKPKYYIEYIERHLIDNYGADTCITDINQTKFMCAAYDAIKKKYEFFTSWQDRYADRNLVDVVLYSMAAITYFGKCNDPKHNAVYTDGAMGLFNSTSVSAAIETPKLGWGEDDRYILNLGCGQGFYKEGDYESVSKWNNIDQIIKIYLPKEIRAANELKRAALNSPITPNIRIEVLDPEMERGLLSLDNYRNASALLKVGQEIAKNAVNLEVLK